jgi:hypothetical protein
MLNFFCRCQIKWKCKSTSSWFQIRGYAGFAKENNFTKHDVSIKISDIVYGKQNKS